MGSAEMIFPESLINGKKDGKKIQIRICRLLAIHF